MGVLGGRAQQDDPLRQLAGEVRLLGRDLARELVAPRAELVCPRLDRVFPASRAVDGEVARPAHAAEMGVHPLQRPFAGGAIGSAVADDRANQFVAVAEHVGRDRDHVADAALDRIAALVDGGPRVLDDDPAWWLVAADGGTGSDRGSRGLDAHI
jgi:hypothetical protein